MSNPAPPLNRLGHWVLTSKLGEGGGGVVYRAEHAQTGAVAALKTVFVPRAGQLSAIYREIAALSRLSHPGVVRILSHGSHDGLPYYVMEWLDGSPFQKHCLTLFDPSSPRATPDGIPALLTLFHRLCAPLAFLHAEGFVHRDLKPGNVLVPSHGHPVVVDFGLAARQAGGLSREVLELQTQVTGTYAYMAPEQLRAELVDARADLYSLGAMLYRALTGQLPRRSLEELLEPGPLALPSQLIPGIPAGVDALVSALLESRPTERPGYAQDVADVLRKLGAVGEETLLASSRIYLYRPGFHGRSAALRGLGQALRERLEAQAPGLLIIGGESGVGKTRVMLEVGRLLSRQGFEVHIGECEPPLEDRPVGPLQPFRAFLLTVAEHCREGGPAVTSRVLGPFIKVLQPFEPALEGLHCPPGSLEPGALGPEGAARLVARGLEHAFRHLSDASLPILLLDDLQWADSLTLTCLDYWLGSTSSQECPMLVLATCRDEEQQEGIGRLLKRPQVHAFALGRLDLDGVAGLVSDMLAMGAPPPVFTQAIYQLSDGSPFFAAEYLRSAAAAGLLLRRQGRWQILASRPLELEEAVEGLPVPPALSSLVDRRLELLSPDVCRLAEAAAVLGRELWPDRLAALLGQSEESLASGLQTLIFRQVLEEGPQGCLRFLHGQLREAAWRRLPAEERARLHRAAAEALEQESEGEKALQAGALAFHWEQAAEVEKALDWYVVAARGAVKRYAIREGERMYRAGLRLTGEGALRWQLEAELARDILYFQGRGELALPILQNLLQDAPETCGRERALARLVLARILRLRGKLEAALQEGQQALEGYRRMSDEEGEGVTLTNLGAFLLEAGRLEEALATGQAALAVHRRRGDVRFEGVTLGNLAGVQAARGQWQDARRNVEQAILLHQACGNRLAESRDRGNLASLLKELGELPAARKCLEEALQLGERLGYTKDRAMLLTSLAEVLLAEGSWTEAERQASAALELHAEVGNSRGRAESLWARALCRSQRGAWAEAEQDMSALLEVPGLEAGLRACALALGVRLARLGQQGVDDRREKLKPARREAEACGEASARALCALEEAWLGGARSRNQGPKSLEGASGRLACYLTIWEAELPGGLAATGGGKAPLKIKKADST